MIKRLVVNGCSYMKYYEDGGGTEHLAKILNLSEFKSLACNGVCNNRILRTTLRDIYSTNTPTLYIVGTTFINRFEMTALQERTEDGKWTSFNGWASYARVPDMFAKHISVTDFNNFVKGHVSIMNGSDLCEDLMYRLLSLVDCAKFNNHQILIFNTAEHSVDYYLNEPQFDPFKHCKEIIGGYDWRSIPWQFEQGADYLPEDEEYPANCRHVKPGDHRWLNEFLTNYINEHKILQ